VHIAEGVLTAPVLVAGAAVTACGCGIGIRKMDYRAMPRVAVISSVFFVASLIHVPVGPTSAHLVLNGLAGIVLGWLSYPALLMALFLQAVLFQFGGLTVLGVNTASMATPALVCYLGLGGMARHRRAGIAYAAGFLAGALGVALSALGTALALAASGEAFLPVMAIEGLLTGFVLLFVKKVQPDLLTNAP
jgi:cobalt/nickel transport system permease protein